MQGWWEAGPNRGAGGETEGAGGPRTTPRLDSVHLGSTSRCFPPWGPLFPWKLERGSPQTLLLQIHHKGPAVQNRKLSLQLRTWSEEPTRALCSGECCWGEL